MYKLIMILSIAFFMMACSDDGTASHSNEHKHDSSKVNVAAGDTTKKSIPSEIKRLVGNTEVTINYHSPAVRGRTIWGGLVAYDVIWVTGAHKATTLEVEKDFQVGGKNIPAGKYALFTIPGKDEWTVIINKKWDQHLADDYSESEDVVRLKVKPLTTASHTERLKYEIEPTGDRTANIIISWEKIQVLFGITIS